MKTLVAFHLLEDTIMFPLSFLLFLIPLLSSPQSPGMVARGVEPTHIIVAEVNDVFVRRRVLAPAHDMGDVVLERYCLEVTVRSCDRGEGLRSGDVIFVRYDVSMRPDLDDEYVAPRAGMRVRLDAYRTRGGLYRLLPPGSWSQVPREADGVNEAILTDVRRLLEESHRSFLSSTIRWDPELDPDQRILRLGPVEELAELYRRRDLAVLRSSGTIFGGLARSLAPERFSKLFLADLSSPETEWRVFAINALQRCPSPDAVPGLIAALDEPGARLDAAFALARLGQDECLPALFDYASRSQYWIHDVLPAIRCLTDQDFGEDLNAWRRHFESIGALPEPGPVNPPRAR